MIKLGPFDKFYKHLRSDHPPFNNLLLTRETKSRTFHNIREFSRRVLRFCSLGLRGALIDDETRQQRVHRHRIHCHEQQPDRVGNDEYDDQQENRLKHVDAGSGIVQNEQVKGPSSQQSNAQLAHKHQHLSNPRHHCISYTVTPYHLKTVLGCHAEVLASDSDLNVGRFVDELNDALHTSQAAGHTVRHILHTLISRGSLLALFL